MTAEELPPHWTAPGIFPEVDVGGRWGVFGRRGHEPLPLEGIIERIDEGPGKTLWSGQPEHPEVILVTRPESLRPVPAIECVELQSALLAHDERALSARRRKSGLVFYPLLLITLVLEFGLQVFSVLPAVFAVITGAEHVEAWLELRQLRNDPARYVHHKAAQLRYSAWLSIAGAGRRCRACWMVGLWIVIGCIQFFFSAGSSGSITAAGLVKGAVAAEPWRLLTGPMLHGSVLHLLMNAGAMWSLGLLLERGVHRHLVSAVWLLGALAGSLLSWAATPATSVGASGGILAVFAFLLVMGRRRRAQLPPDFGASLARSVVMIALLGLLAWGVIDNAAHLGGAMAGALLGAWVFREPKGTLPLADSASLRTLSVFCDSAFVLIAALTIAKVAGLL